MKIFLSQQAGMDALVIIGFIRKINPGRVSEIVKVADLGDLVAQVHDVAGPVLVITDHNKPVQAAARLLRAGSQRRQRELVLVFAHEEEFPRQARDAELFDGFVDKAQAGSFRPVAELIAGVTDEDTVTTLKERHPFIRTPPNW